MRTTQTRNFALFFMSLAITATLGCDPKPSTAGDTIIGVGDLGSLKVEIDRDGRGDYYPRTITVRITLPWPEIGCAILDPSMTFTLNGRPPLYEISRGGLSPYPGFFNEAVCENFAGATFRMPDEGGALVVRIEQKGSEPAEIEFDAPALEPLALVAPADGRLRPGDIATVRVPPSFYTSRHINRPGPHAIGSGVFGNNPAPFEHAIILPRGEDLADRGSHQVHGGVGVGTEDLLVEVPSYTPPGPKSLYVAYLFSALFEPMPIRRCQGFAECSGESRDNFSVLGPIDVVVE